MSEQTPMVINQERVGSIFLDDPLIIQDEEGNVLSSGLRSTSRLTPTGIGLLNDSLGADTLSGVALNAIGLAYSNLTETKTATWENITTKIEAIAAISQASNATTLNINNTLQVQNGETIDTPTPYVSLTADAVGTRLSLSGDAGSNGYVLTSGGSAGSLSWAVGGGGGSQDLQQVLDVGNVATDTSIVSQNADATAISSLSSFGLTMSVQDPADPLNTVFVVGLEQNSLTYRDANTPTNQSGMGSGGFSINVENPEDPGQPFTAVSINTNGIAVNNPDNQTESSVISPQGVSLSITDTGTGDNNQTTISSGGVFITLQNNDFPENPAPANLIDIYTISIKEDQNDANDTTTTVLGQHNLNYQQIYLGESKDILQMNKNSLTMKNVGAVQKDLVELQNLDDLNGLLNLRSTENDNVITLSNSALTFSNVEGDNWTINQSTDTANNLTISQTGTAGYMDLNFNELLIRGGAGNAGQVITSGGTNGNFTWEDAGSNYPIVSTLEYYISTTSPYFQYPPVPPTVALIQAYQYYGWYFINAVVARTASWYFAPDYQMTVADVKGLYMNYFNITTTSNDDLPYISIYTKPTGTNDAIPGFAHSVNTFVPTFTPIAASPFCSFMNISGTQQDPFPYGHILGAMEQSTVNNPRGEYLPTEEVLAVAVGTNSASSVNQVAFIMSKVGICLEQGNQELILNPQNISEQPTLSTVLALGNTAGNSSISGVNNLSATSITTPTLANGSATLTVGTLGQITNIVGTLQNNGAELPAYISSSGVASGSIDMNSNTITECNSLDSVSSLTLGGTTALGVNVGRSAQTTDLLGNIQFNSSSGTSGQVLTSTGATTAPTWQASASSSYISASGVASGSIDMNSNSITECNSLDSASALALGGTTALGTTLGRSTQTTNLLGNLQVNSQAGTSGQYLKSNGSGSVPTWASPTLLVSAPAQSTPNAGVTTPYQLFISTVINGIAGEWYLFTFRTNLTSATSSESPEIAMTLTTTAGNTTPTTTNSFNVTTPSSNILTTRPDELTSLCISKHYGAITGRQDQTMNFTYMYQFASTATITFGVWSWSQLTSGNYNRKNVSLNYVRLNA